MNIQFLRGVDVVCVSFHSSNFSYVGLLTQLSEIRNICDERGGKKHVLVC